MKLLNFIFLSLFVSFCVNAREKSDAFIVRAYDSHYKVLTPTKLNRSNSVFIYNHTLKKIIGKLENSQNDKIIFVTIPAGKYKTVDIKVKKGEEHYFVPMSPPFQKVILKTGIKAYEIPPRKQDK